MFAFIKIFLILAITLSIGIFAYLALTDLPVQQTETVVDIELAK